MALGLPVLTNQVGFYKSTLRGEIKVKRWIDERILNLWSVKVEGILLLIAVVQPTKKIRLVLDF